MMIKKRFLAVSLISLLASFCFAAEEVIISIIKSPYPVTSVGWSKDGYKFAYPGDRRVLIRRSADYSLLQTIFTANGPIDYIYFPAETMGENLDQLATLSNDNILEIGTTNTENAVVYDSKEYPKIGYASLVASGDNYTLSPIGTSFSESIVSFKSAN